jgi:hypothetical protein
MTLGTSWLPPASSSSTLTAGFSASRHATTEPEEPDPQTMKSQCDFRVQICSMKSIVSEFGSGFALLLRDVLDGELIE